jgi:hypothetical protein
MFRAALTHPFWRYIGLILIVSSERFWRLFKREA